MSREELERLEQDQEARLKAEIDHYEEKSISVLSTAAMVVAGVAVSYVAYRSFFSSKPSVSPKRKKKRIKKNIERLKDQADHPSPSLIANITQDIMRDGAHFLLAYAGGKLAEYINRPR